MDRLFIGVLYMSNMSGHIKTGGDISASTLMGYHVIGTMIQYSNYTHYSTTNLDQSMFYRSQTELNIFKNALKKEV